MKKIIALSAILIGLVGCSSSDDPVANLPATVTDALLNGTWESSCIVDDPDSFTAEVTIFNGDITTLITTYSDSLDCTPVGAVTPDILTSSYTLGSDVTVDGSVAGITTATQIDITDTTPGSPGETDYDIIAIKDLLTFYTGFIDAVYTGKTPATRPIQLDNTPFTKQ